YCLAFTFLFQAEDGIRVFHVTGVQTCALPIFSRRLALGRISAMRFSGGTPDRLIVAPTDLHPADSFAGEEITAGRFPLAGRILECDGESPFALELPSEEFAGRLHSFGWLRHMRLVDPDRAALTSRFIVDDWLQ